MSFSKGQIKLLDCEKNKKLGGKGASSDKEMGILPISNIVIQLLFVFHGSMTPYKWLTTKCISFPSVSVHIRHSDICFVSSFTVLEQWEFLGNKHVKTVLNWNGEIYTWTVHFSVQYCHVLFTGHCITMALCLMTSLHLLCCNLATDNFFWLSCHNTYVRNTSHELHKRRFCHKYPCVGVPASSTIFKLMEKSV